MDALNFLIDVAELQTEAEEIVNDLAEKREAAPPDILTLLLYIGGMKESSLARMCGVSVTTIRNWQTGKVKISAEHHKRLLRVVSNIVEIYPLVIAEGERNDRISRLETSFWATWLQAARDLLRVYDDAQPIQRVPLKKGLNGDARRTH